MAVPCPGEGLGLCAVSKQHKSAQDEQGGKDNQSQRAFVQAKNAAAHFVLHRKEQTVHKAPPA